MASFLCRVADARGHIFTQVEEASSEVEVRQRLSERGLYIYSVRGQGLPALAWNFSRKNRPGFSSDNFLLFNQQFVTLVRAGLPILKSLDLLATRLTGVEREAACGKTVTHALAQGAEVTRPLKHREFIEIVGAI